MAMVNKKSFTEKTNKIIIELGKEQIATKVSMANIILPSDEEIGRLYTKILGRLVFTPEHPEGYRYAATDRPLFRVFDGRVFDKKGMADAYAWTEEDYASKVAKVVPIGFGYMATLESVTWAMKVLETIKDEKEKEDLTLFLIKYPDLKLVFSKEEKRTVVEVTKEMINAGLTEIVDSYTKPDNEGMAITTDVHLGDFLVKDKESYYLIQRKPFFETHTI